MTNAPHNLIESRTAVRGPALTSRQQFTVLDTFIARALAPLESESESFLEWVADILASTVKSRRSNANEHMMACTAVLSGAPNPVKLLLESGLDRGHAFTYLQNVHALYETMQQAEIAIARGDTNAQHISTLHHVRDILGGSPRLSPALCESAYWRNLALSWRDSIIDNYLRMLRKNAAGASRLSGGRIEADPVFHDGWITAAQTVDRYRSEQATFTKALNKNLLSTYRIAASHAMGLAAPGARVKSVNALQTTLLDDDAGEQSYWKSGTGQQGATNWRLELPDAHAQEESNTEAQMILRAALALSGNPDVRAALLISNLNPVDAMRAAGKLTPQI